MVEHCVACHRPESRKGGYDLAIVANIAKGRKQAVVLPGKPEESRLFLMLTGDETPAMPKDAPRLSAEKIAIIERWIRDGARFDGLDPQTDIRTLVPKPTMSQSTPNPAVASPVTALTFSPDGARLLAGAGHGILEVTLGDKPTPSKWLPLEFTPYGFAFAAHNDSVLIAGGVPGQSGRIDLGHTTSMRAMRQVARSADVIHGVRWAADGKQFAAVGMERIVRVWKHPQDANPVSLEPVSDAAFDVCFSNDSRLLLVAGRDKTVKVWDLAQKETIAVFAGHQDSVQAVLAIPGTDRAVSASADGSVRIWTLTSGKERAVNSSFGKPIVRMLLDGKGKRLFIGGADGLVAVLSASEAKVIRAFEGHKDWVFALALSPDEKILAAGGWDGIVRLWDVASGKPLRQFPAKP